MLKQSQLREKLGRIGYVQASLALCAICVLISIYLFCKAVLTDGGLTRSDGVLGVLGMLLAGSGFAVALNGHFYVRLEHRLDYRLALIPNGILFLIYVFLYFFGI